MTDTPLLNYQVHLPGLLATGGKPDRHEKLDWLITQGFQCIISLEPIPDSISGRFLEAGLNSMVVLHHEADEDGKTQSLILETIASQIAFGQTVYMHCSAGISLSPKLARRFVTHQDLLIADYLARRANDLNHGDNFDWSRGHSAFGGDRIFLAISALGKGLASTDEKTQLLAADTLAELMEHADHGCFDRGAEDALREIFPKVSEIVLRLNPGYQERYQKIFDRFSDYVAKR